MIKISQPSTLQLLHEIRVYDLNHKLIRVYPKRPSHSFVLNFLRMMEGASNHQGYQANLYYPQLRDTSGAYFNWGTAIGNFPYSCWIYSMSIRAAVTNDDYGILIGTGTDAPTSSDYKLQTKIIDGSGASQMLYGNMCLGNAGVIGSNVEFTFLRPFTNVSGGTITLKEFGLATILTGSGFGAYTLLIRDVCDVPVLDDNYCVIAYSIRTTV